MTLALVALEPSLVNCRMKAQTNRIRSVMSEDCVVLLEEFVQSNLDLAAENKKLRYMEISSFYTEFSISEHDALTRKIGF